MADSPASPRSTGVLPSQAIRGLVEAGEIRAATPPEDGQIQPASLDLRLGPLAYRVRASFLPGPGRRVDEQLKRLSMHRIDLTGGAVLEKGCVYIVPLVESLALRKGTSGAANPKSSTGRLDIFTRLIIDGGTTFDQVPDGYAGPLYAEISPRTFSVLVRAGTRLNQLRLRRGNPTFSRAELERLHADTALVDGETAAAPISDRGVLFTVDLKGDGALVGYKARAHTDLIDLDRIGHYDPLDFWEPIMADRGPQLILEPDEFYILASREAVTVPPDHAAEMVPYDTLMGEFRVHYAGFFDPGFGHAGSGGAGSRAVLEVRSHEVPFVIEHGQVVGRMVYERLTARPEKVYGEGIGSNYQRQGLQLGKQFRRG